MTSQNYPWQKQALFSCNNKSFWLVIMSLVGFQILNFWWLRTYTRSNLGVIWIIILKIVWLRWKLIFHYHRQIFKKQQPDLESIISIVKKRLKLAQPEGNHSARGARLHPVIFHLALSAFMKKDCQLKFNFVIAIYDSFIKARGHFTSLRVNSC